VQEKLPIKTKKKKQRIVTLAASVLCNQRGEFLIHKRGNEGLLANLWEFPNIEINLPYKTEKQQLTSHLRDFYSIEAELTESIGRIDHVFSHLEWNINVYSGIFSSGIEETSHIRLVSYEQLNEFAFPVPHQKILRRYLDNRKIKTP